MSTASVTQSIKWLTQVAKKNTGQTATDLEKLITNRLANQVKPAGITSGLLPQPRDMFRDTVSLSDKMRQGHGVFSPSPERSMGFFGHTK